jgi:hypothetical protein
MARLSVPQLLKTINQQIYSQEQSSMALSKAEALLEVALTADFQSRDSATVYHYLLIINETIEQAKKTQEQTIDSLLEVSKQIKESIEFIWVPDPVESN